MQLRCGFRGPVAESSGEVSNNVSRIQRCVSSHDNERDPSPLFEKERTKWA